MFKRKQSKGQSTLENAVIVIIVVGALIAMQNYIRRGIQGRWQSSIDGVGGQYDPNQATVDITHRVYGNTITNISAVSALGRTETLRSDQANMIETKSGFQRVDAN